MDTRQRNTDKRFKKPTSFAFSQIVREHASAPRLSDLPVLRTSGELHIREDHTAGLKSIRVESEVHHDDRCLVTVEGPSEKMTMTTFLAQGCGRSRPQLSSSETGVSAKVTVWISRGLHLSSFSINTDSLDVIFHENVPIPKHTPISICAPSSSVKFTSNKLPSHLTIDSRQTTLTTQSGSVTGDFTLRDTLKIHTQSGSININLSLLSSNITTPATLDLQAQSGSIKVATTTILTPSKIPHRDYHSTLRTQSGSIRATLVHGTSTTLHSSSSSIHASLYPHDSSSAGERSDLITHVLSGSTDITVHPSLSSPSAPLRNFHASHTGISGSIRILYPAQWEGTVEGSTVSGSIRYDWPGLKIVEDGRGWVQKKLKGVKGVGKGVVAFRDVSGSVELKGMDAVVVPVDETPREEETKPAEEAQRAVDIDEVESVMDEGDHGQKVLTPGSEAGDEWLFVQ
ncbi:MAG: hypothetical protein L6R38_006576 [Xanthoria sp. 2 TBL-2021]|nr:MAG: hypothetical protein L6R38_006576 [Xanthoria sp. 2 TBL-2021]